MSAFMFRKVSSPLRKTGGAEPRGTIVRLLDTMTEMRLRREVSRLLGKQAVTDANAGPPEPGTEAKPETRPERVRPS